MMPWQYKKGAITEWQRFAPILCSERMSLALGHLRSFKFDISPKPKRVMDVFRVIMPDSVRVVIIAQSPYPGNCPSTGIPYACGLAFMPSRGCKTTPKTLMNVVSEVCRDLGSKPTVSPQQMLWDWVDQGVMLLNSSLTLGVNCPKYLEDHAVFWQEIMQHLVSTICTKVDPVFVLVGKDAHRLENCLLPYTRVIKVSHPVARKETSTPWYGSSIFSRVSQMMVERGDVPVKWM